MYLFFLLFLIPFFPMQNKKKNGNNKKKKLHVKLVKFSNGGTKNVFIFYFFNEKKS